MYHQLRLKTIFCLKSLSHFKHQRYSSSNLTFTNPNAHLTPTTSLNQQDFSYIVSSNKKITNFIRAGYLDSALAVFNGMKFKTTITYNSILNGYSKKQGKIKEARHLFDKMPERDCFSYNTMLACYLNSGDVVAGKRFFDEMPVKDVTSWNTMISGLCRNGMMSEAEEMFLAMPEKNGRSWNAMISGYVEEGDLEAALELFKDVPTKCVVTWTSIITGYMKSRKVGLAENMFKEMPEKNLATWNAMIAGYVENGRAEDGLLLFRKMIDLRVEVNQSSLSSVLLGCSNLSELKFGKQVHQLVSRSPLSVDTTVGTALISMYCKCGNLEDASKLFLEMPFKDIVTWNAMISGYAQHGQGKESIRLFDEMTNQGLTPDRITFVGVLIGCSHAGFVDLGTQYFENMEASYGVKQTSDHYSCMVDLLGRAGKLAEAKELIAKMPFRPHAAVFGTLLGACRIHKNVEMAEYAATNLLNCNPLNAAGYVQLANIYALKNEWANVSMIRKSMKQTRVVKNPGYSWIEIKNVVHEFRSGDRIHPELKYIHNKLYELERKMKLAGYVPDLDFALHDVEEDQKEQLLLRHSEKLAIAFGLLRLPTEIPIRVFKNLRVCGDCHQATKFISEIEGREIILRDSSRFHHFKDGKCSCGDYW
ncbi:hypothetical protein Leryth_015985 [Lithospermum erythrorhizon]|nr:hypothetical protein Leryth_015985 [Lithospermum erythrorhizon]